VDGQRVEHLARADVPGVEDVVGSLRRDELCAPRVGLAVRVGDDDDAEGPIGAELERLVGVDEGLHA
jgi:hypothetical protein